MGTLDKGRFLGPHNRKVALGSPVLAVLATDGDAAPDWLRAGRALARVLLRARVDGVWASFLNQPIEVPALRPRLAQVIGEPGFPHPFYDWATGRRWDPRRAEPSTRS